MRQEFDVSFKINKIFHKNGREYFFHINADKWTHLVMLLD